MTNTLIQKFEKKLFWLKRIPWITYALLQILMTLFFLNSMSSEKSLLSYESTELKIYLLISTLILFGSLMAYFVTKTDTERVAKAISLSKSHRPNLELNQEFLIIPILMLMNPAFWRALDQNLSEIIIPRKDIVNAKIYSGLGSSLSVLVLELKGESQIYSQGQIGDVRVFNFGLKIQLDLKQALQKEIAEKLIQKSF